MRRLALTAALLWTAAFLVFYLIVVHSQGDEGPAWWLVVLLVVAMGLLGVAVTGVGGEKLPIVTSVMLGLAMVAGLLSVGLLLLPAVVAAGLAAAWSPPRPVERIGERA